MVTLLIITAMRLVLILCVIAAITAKEEEKNDGHPCDGLEVRGKFHRKDILAKGLNRPYQLSYYKHRREIYFSYNIGSDEEDKFEIAWLAENSTEHKPIVKVKNGFAIAIDHHDHAAYYGGSEGIYRSTLNTKDAMTHIIEKQNIWDMFFKHHLYYITYPSQKLYKYTHKSIPHKQTKNTTKSEPEHQKWIHEKVYQFAIDGDDDVFITNETGLYMIKNGSEHRHLLEGEKVFRAIEINNNGEAHFAGQNAIYVPIKHNHTLHKIAHVKNIFGLTFDGEDHIIYSNPHQIVKLMPSVCNINVKVPFVPIQPILNRH